MWEQRERRVQIRYLLYKKNTKHLFQLSPFHALAMKNLAQALMTSFIRETTQASTAQTPRSFLSSNPNHPEQSLFPSPHINPGTQAERPPLLLTTHPLTLPPTLYIYHIGPFQTRPPGGFGGNGSLVSHAPLNSLKKWLQHGLPPNTSSTSRSPSNASGTFTHLGNANFLSNFQYPSPFSQAFSLWTANSLSTRAPYCPQCDWQGEPDSALPPR